MKRSTKIIISILSMLILMALGIEMVSNNVIQIMSVEETNKELQEIVANAQNQQQLQTPSVGGASQESEITCGDLNGADTSAQYLYGPGTYCGGHGLTIARRRSINGGTPIPDVGNNGGRKQQTTYEYYNTTEMAQSIAFAKAFGAQPDEIQNLIWASDDWLNYTGNVSCLATNSQRTHYHTYDKGIYGRSYKFANFIYIGLKDGDGDLGLQGAPLEGSDPRLNIMVNQDDNTYTVGPYAIGFENEENSVLYGNPGDLMKDLVWDEITHNYDHKFISGLIDATVTFQDGSKSKQSPVDVLDADGNIIKEGFPKFGEDFYLRYHTTKEDQIVEKIRPRVRIEYIKKIKKIGGKVRPEIYIYHPGKITYSMIFDGADLIVDAIKWGAWYGDEHIEGDPPKGPGWGFWYDHTQVKFGFTETTFDSSTAFDNYAVGIKMDLKIQLELAAKASGYWDADSDNYKIDWDMVPGIWLDNKFYENGTVSVSTSSSTTKDKNGNDVTEWSGSWTGPDSVTHSLKNKYSSESDAEDAAKDAAEAGAGYFGFQFKSYIYITESDPDALMGEQPALKLSSVGCMLGMDINIEYYPRFDIIPHVIDPWWEPDRRKRPWNSTDGRWFGWSISWR